MERKLKEYRAKQERLNNVQKVRNKLKTIFSWILPNKKEIVDKTSTSLLSTEVKKPILPTKSVLIKRKMDISKEAEPFIIPEDAISIDEESLSDDSIWCCSWLQLLYYSLYFILWITVYMIFIKIQFGTVYLISSGLIFICLNTRTSPKRTGEMSAYSVFNKDCARIDGTLKAEQFEREIIFGAASLT